MSYPAPPPADPPPSRSSSRSQRVDAQGFFNDLFDVRFTRFVSLRLISVVYVLILAAASLLALIAVFGGFAGGPVPGLLTLVLAGLGWIITVVLARVALEAYAVLFRIHDATSRMAGGSAGGARAGGDATQAYDAGGVPPGYGPPGRGQPSRSPSPYPYPAPGPQGGQGDPPGPPWR